MIREEQGCNPMSWCLPGQCESANMAQACRRSGRRSMGRALYMNAVTVNGASHNVLLLTTDNDSVYALDADTEPSFGWSA